MSKRAEELGYSQISEENIAYMILPSYPGRGIEITSPVPGSDNLGDIMLNSAYQESLWDFLQGFFLSNTDDGVQS
jgi:hypothetical protein